MKKNIPFRYLVCSIVFLMLLLGSFFIKSIQKSFSQTDLTITLASSGEEFTPYFYEKNFDFNYYRLPVITTTEVTDTLIFHPTNPKVNELKVHVDYYNDNYIERENDTVSKDAHGEFLFDVTKRSTTRPNQNGIYFIKSGEGTFVFQLKFENPE